LISLSKTSPNENELNLIGVPAPTFTRSPMAESCPTQPFTGAEHGSPPAHLLVVGVIPLYSPQHYSSILPSYASNTLLCRTNVEGEFSTTREMIPGEK
jgi:hypothetical protein